MPAKKKSEIFETEDDDDIENEVVAEEPVVEEPVVEAPPAKKQRKKRVISEETRARLREQLKKGRETSLANRRKKKEMTAMKREKEREAKDEELMKHLESKKIKSNLARENELLRLKLKDLEAKKEQRRPDTPPPKEIKKEKPVEKMQPIKEVPKPKPVVAPRHSLLPGGFKLSDIYRM